MPNRILKRGSNENLYGFLKTIEKIVKKKKQLADIFKQKSNMDKKSFKIVIINTLGNSGKKNCQPQY